MTTTPPTWADQARGLYAEDLSYWQIGKRLGVRPSTIYNYSRRHWPRRTCDDERQKKFHPAAPAKVKRFARGEPTLPPLPSLQ